MTAAAACAAFVGLTACSTTTAGTPVASTATSRSTTAPTHFPMTAHDLAAQVQAALVTIKSMHLAMTIKAAGLDESADGDQTVVNARTQDANLILSVPNFGTIQMVIVNGKTYVQVPPNQRTSGKPWALVTPTSSNPFVQALAPGIEQAQSFSGPHAALQMLGAAQSFKFNGTARLSDGSEVGRYRVSVGVSGLPFTAAQRALLSQVGIRTIPLDLTVDTAGRIRGMTETIHVRAEGVSETTSTEVQMSGFNNPVSVQAPPSSEVQYH